MSRTGKFKFQFKFWRNIDFGHINLQSL